MIKTGTKTSSCIFAGDKPIQKVMINNKLVYPKTDYIVFPEVIGHDNSLFIFTIKVNQYRTNWRAVDFANGSGDHLWRRYVHPNEPYMISFYRISSSIGDWATVKQSYIEGIYIQRCVFGCSTANTGRDLPNLTTIRINKDITRMKNLHALGWNSPRLKYVLGSLNNYVADFTVSDYICGDSGIKYLEAVDTHHSRTHLLRNTSGTRIRPSKDELGWLNAAWGNRHEMSNLDIKQQCIKSTSTLTKYKKFSQFRYVPLRLVASDATNRMYHTVCQLGLFDENGVNFARQTGSVYTSSTNSIHVGTRAFDGSWSTFWHCNAPLGGTYLDKHFNTRHQLDFVRIKARNGNLTRNVTYFWVLGRNSSSAEWEHIASIDCAPTYKEAWGNDEQRGWPLSEFNPLFAICEVDPSGLFIKINLGRAGNMDLVPYNIVSPNRYFKLRVNGVPMGIKVDNLQLFSPGFTMDLFFQIDGRVKRGDTVELDYDGSMKTLYAIDSRIRGKSGYGGFTFLPTSNNMHVNNRSTH